MGHVRARLHQQQQPTQNFQCALNDKQTNKQGDYLYRKFYIITNQSNA